LKDISVVIQILPLSDVRDSGKIHQVWKIWTLKEGYDGRKEQWEDYSRILLNISGKERGHGNDKPNLQKIGRIFHSHQWFFT